MISSKHVDQRMNQRGITRQVVETAMDFGVPHNDRYCLGRKEAQRAISLLQSQLKTLKKLADKGGITVVFENGMLITTWNNC